MARKPQQLINYHTGSLNNMPLSGDVQFGEIVVRHNNEAPELMIKVSSGTSQTDAYGEYFAKFVDENAVDTKIRAAVITAQGGLESQITNLQNDLAAASATVTNNYWTSAQTLSQIETASGATLEQAKQYADTQDEALSGRIVTHIQTAITDAITGDVVNIKSDISNLKSFSGKVESDYATKTYAENEADAAELAAKIASSAYTDAEIAKLSGITSAYVASQLTASTHDIEVLQSNMTAVSGSLVSLSAKVESDYATKEFVGSASGYAYNQAKTDLIGESTDAATADTIWGAKNYASGLTKTLSGDLITYVDGQISDANSDITNVANDVAELSGSVESMSGDIKTYIDNELSVVYKYKGSVANVAELSEIDDPEVGDVYNVVAANGEPGDSGYTPAGTNYAWVGESSEGVGDGHWDALGGVVDLSNYTTTGTTEAIDGRVTELESTVGANGNDISAISGAVSAFSASVVATYATSADTVTAIKTAKDEAVTSAYTSSTAYTDEQIAILSGISSAYTNQQITNLQSSIDNILTGYAFSSITHQEISDAKSAVIGPDDATSAQTDNLKGLKLYSDEKDRLLHEEIASALEALSGAVSGDFSSIETQITNLASRVSDNEDKFTNSAATWNSALQHGQLGTVSESAEGNGVTIQSGAKLKEDVSTKTLTLDLSSLVIDCGDF